MSAGRSSQLVADVAVMRPAFRGGRADRGGRYAVACLAHGAGTDAGAVALTTAASPQHSACPGLQELDVAHLTLVHGIANKVAPDQLLQGWLDALRDEGGLDLRAEGVSTSMCYWADVLHEAPLPSSAWSMEAGEEAEVLSAPDVGSAWFADLPPEQGLHVLELAAEADALSALDDEAPADDGSTGGAGAGAEPGGEVAGGFERLPLPGSLKQLLMRAFLRDVHHYLWDAESTPRPQVSFRVRTEVRRRMVDVLLHGAERPGPHVVLAHSLGSVIAYDVLQNVDGAPEVQDLITFGSPLGLDEVQDRLLPGWSRWDGFPRERVEGGWWNAYDRLDPVCGFDPVLANDFRDRGRSRVVDVHEPSHGSWRHSAGKYLGGRQLRAALGQALEVR